MSRAESRYEVVSKSSVTDYPLPLLLLNVSNGLLPIGWSVLLSLIVSKFSKGDKVVIDRPCRVFDLTRAIKKMLNC